MDGWRTSAHRGRQRFRAFFERLRQPDMWGGEFVGRFWASEPAMGSAAFARIFADAESISSSAASDAIAEGRLVLRFTATTDATLTVTESNAGAYLCCYEPSSSWLSRSSPETTYYRFGDHSWLELTDTLLPLLALDWELTFDHATARDRGQPPLTADEHSNTE